MRKIEAVLHDGDLYKYSAGSFCGVLVTKKVMKKLVKLQHEHLRAVKALLLDGADEDDVFPAMWALHYPEGKQTPIDYIDTSADLKDHISRAVHSGQPERLDTVFVSSSMDEAEAMADSLLEEA